MTIVARGVRPVATAGGAFVGPHALEGDVE
jgi:hypothetical protein